MPRDVRGIKVAAAQMGPNNEGTSREEIVERMLGLLAEAVREGVVLIAYPEMALTTYFPKKIRPDFDQFFETEVPPKALEPLLRRAAEARIAVHVGFCEKADGTYFNSALLTGRDGRLLGTFRKIHLPGTKAADGFAHGDTGYRVWDCAGARVGIAICQDRRYPESYRALALQGAEIILIGYNTPISALALDLNDLCMRAGAYANACFVVGVAKAGIEDGVELIGGSSITTSCCSRSPRRSRTDDAGPRSNDRARRRSRRQGRPRGDGRRRYRYRRRHQRWTHRRAGARGMAAARRSRHRRDGQARVSRSDRLPPARRARVRRLEGRG